MPYERGESIQSPLCIKVWGCAHLHITLGSPPVSISFPVWQKRWDLAIKITDCQLLCFEGDCYGGVSLYISLVPEHFPSSKDMIQRSIWGGRSWRWGDWKIMGENCFSTVGYLLSSRAETLQLYFSLYFSFYLETSSDGNYNIIWVGGGYKWRDITEGINYNLTSQVLQCVLGFHCVFLLKYSLKCLGISGASGQVFRLEGRKLAVRLVFRACICHKGLVLKLWVSPFSYIKQIEISRDILQTEDRTL